MYKMTPYDKSKLFIREKSMSKNYKFIIDFINSDYDCIRVDNYDHKTCKSCYDSLHRSVKQHGFKNVIVLTKKGEVYLLKK